MRGQRPLSAMLPDIEAMPCFKRFLVLLKETGLTSETSRTPAHKQIRRSETCSPARAPGEDLNCSFSSSRAECELSSSCWKLASSLLLAPAQARCAAASSCSLASLSSTACSRRVSHLGRPKWMFKLPPEQHSRACCCRRATESCS